MLLHPYLAMTAREMETAPRIDFPVAWMACHFSPYGTGLSNMPRQLPAHSLLILNDRTPICGHDPDRIAAQLAQTVEAFSCCGILLDFQRPGERETSAVVDAVTALPCPVAVSSCYGEKGDGAVFLPPVPLTIPLAQHLAPWAGREIWLETAFDAQTVTVTEDGSQFSACPLPIEPLPHTDKDLHCSYRIEPADDHILFTLHRGQTQLQSLIAHAQQLGVTRFVGLYQQLGSSFAQAEAQATARDQL